MIPQTPFWMLKVDLLNVQIVHLALTKTEQARSDTNLADKTNTFDYHNDKHLNSSICLYHQLFGQLLIERNFWTESESETNGMVAV